MSFLSKVLKSGVALKAMEVAKREAAKPENQRKAKELFAKVTQRRGGQAGPSGPTR